jgi:integrase
MCHGFRRFAITHMAEAGMDYEIHERLVGHAFGMAQQYLIFGEQKIYRGVLEGS